MPKPAFPSHIPKGQRHSWPRAPGWRFKAYYVYEDGTYFLLAEGGDGAISSTDSPQGVVWAPIDSSYIRPYIVKRVQWSEVPQEWRNVFARYIPAEWEPADPASVPGLHLKKF